MSGIERRIVEVIEGALQTYLIKQVVTIERKLEGAGRHFLPKALLIASVLFWTWSFS